MPLRFISKTPFIPLLFAYPKAKNLSFYDLNKVLQHYYRSGTVKHLNDFRNKLIWEVHRSSRINLDSSGVARGPVGGGSAALVFNVHEVLPKGSFPIYKYDKYFAF